MKGLEDPGGTWSKMGWGAKDAGNYSQGKEQGMEGGTTRGAETLVNISKH